jgi:glycosyltransferase involved in cell wall biosynthesis
MKLLFAVERLGAEGGMERFLEIVLPALAERGVAVQVLARKIDAVLPGIAATTIGWAAEHDAPNAAAAAAAGRACAQFAPDAVIAQNVMDAAVVEALRRPARLMYHLCDHRPFCPNGDRVLPRTGKNCTLPLGTSCAVHALIDGCVYGPRPGTLTVIQRRRRLRDAVAVADSILVGSEFMRKIAEFNGIPAAQIASIRYPLDEADFAPVDPRASRRVTFIGRFVPQKGLMALVRALGTIPAALRPVLRAVGDGPDRAEALQTAARLGVVLEAPGVADSVEIRRTIDESALVAFPSLWAEPFGRVGIEAFSRGRPVVAFDVGGVSSWLIPDGNGLLVPRGDEHALGAAIARLLADDALRGRLGAQARLDAERYRLAPFIDRFLAIALGHDTGGD